MQSEHLASFGVRDSFNSGASSELSSWAKFEGVSQHDLNRYIQESSGPSMLEQFQRELKEIRDKVGPSFSDAAITLLYLDSKICSDTRLSAYKTLGVAYPNEAIDLAAHRVLRRALEVVDSGSKAGLLNGINTHNHWVTLISGATLSVERGLLTGRLDNQNGARVSKILQRALRPLSSNKHLKNALLTHLTAHNVPVEILDSSSTRGYTMELSAVSETFLSNILKPLLTGAAIVASGNEYGWIISALGLAALPAGSKIYEYEKNTRQPMSRFASHVGVDELSSDSLMHHLKMVTGLRAIGELPTIAQTALSAMRTQLGDWYLGWMLAAVDAFSGYQGMLSLHRTKATVSNDVLGLEKILEYLESDESAILSPWNFPAHVENETAYRHIISPRIRNGIVLDHFKPVFGSFPKDGISAEFERGKVYGINAPSGLGKSAYSEALRHTINHSGGMYAVTDGKITDYHEYGYRGIQDKVIYISKESLNVNTQTPRIVDYLSEVFRFAYESSNSDPILVELRSLMQDLLPWQRDVLFHAAYDNSQTVINNPEFTSAIRSRIPDFFRIKQQFTDMLLKDLFLLDNVRGALVDGKSVTSLSYYSQISKGQQQRIMDAIIFGYIRYGNPDVLILDEILEGLDKTNVEYVMHRLVRLMGDADEKPVIFWISQTREDIPYKFFGRDYTEFDIASGMFEQDKATRLKEHMFDNHPENFDESELNELMNGLGQMVHFVRLFSAYDIESRKKYLGYVERYIDHHHMLSTDWQRYISYLSEKCGYTVSSQDVLRVLSDKGMDRIGSANKTVNDWSYELLLYTWFDLPLFYWLNDPDKIGSLFGPMSVGEAVTFGPDARDLWERFSKYPFTQQRYSNHWVENVLVNALDNYVGEIMSSPEQYWNSYKNMLEQTLIILGQDKDNLIYQFFGFKVLAKLKDEGQSFIDRLDSLMRTSWDIRQAQPIQFQPVSLAVTQMLEHSRALAR